MYGSMPNPQPSRATPSSVPEIPRIIWVLWFQGFNEAPDLVRRCLRSWSVRNPEWEVILLNRQSISRYADFDPADYPCLGPSQQSDLLRLGLLARHGGVWADATTFCVQPLDTWLPAASRSGFFAFSNPGPDRLIASWFLCAEEANPLVEELLASLLKYFRENKVNNAGKRLLCTVLERLLGRDPSLAQWWFSVPVRRVLKMYPYFVLHYMFARILWEDPRVAEIWEATPKTSAAAPHRLQVHGLLRPITPDLRDEIDLRAVPIYKLTWKGSSDWYPSDSVLSYLLDSLPEDDPTVTRTDHQ